MDGAKDAGSFNKLDELVVTTLQLLGTVWTGEGRLEGERGTRRAKVKDRGRGGRDSRE